MQILFLVSEMKHDPFEFGNLAGKKRFFRQAEIACDEIVISSWSSLVVFDGQVFACRGIVRKDGKERPIAAPHLVKPYYVHVIEAGRGTIRVHRNNLHVMHYLIDNGIIESNEISEEYLIRQYMSHIRNDIYRHGYMSCSHMANMSRWHMEECFQYADAHGINVNRPNTSLLQKAEVLEVLADLPKDKTIIVKPYNGEKGEGIHVVCKKNLKDKRKIFKSDPQDRYVVQDFISDTCLYKGHKADLRVYVGVFSWRTPKFRVYRHAWPRISTSEFDEIDEDSCITSFSKNLRIAGNCPTTDEYLDEINEDRDQIWRKIDAQVEQSLKAIWSARHPLHNSAASEDNLDHTISLLGYDVMLEQTPDGVVPHILGFCNRFPFYPTEEGSERINTSLDLAFGQFFNDVREYVATGEIPREEIQDKLARSS